MIRATIYGDDDGSDGASAWALDDNGSDGDGAPVRLASGTEPTRAAAESAAEDFARRFGSPLGRWAQGPLPGTRIALAEAFRRCGETADGSDDPAPQDDERYTAPAVAAAVSDVLRGAGIDPEVEPERRDRILAEAWRLLRAETTWRETGEWPE